MTVKMKTDNIVTKKGFKAIWTSTNIGAAPTTIQYENYETGTGKCAVGHRFLLSQRKDVFNFCEAQEKGRAKGQPRKVTKRSFIDCRLTYTFPDALH